MLAVDAVDMIRLTCATSQMSTYTYQGYESVKVCYLTEKWQCLISALDLSSSKYSVEKISPYTIQNIVYFYGKLILCQGFDHSAVS